MTTLFEANHNARLAQAILSRPALLATYGKALREAIDRNGSAAKPSEFTDEHVKEILRRFESRYDHVWNVTPEAEQEFVVHGSPVSAASNGKAATIASAYWSDLWAKCPQGGKDSVRSVGRIQFAGQAYKAPLGTGWFVADDVVVTARHVALEFAEAAAPHHFLTTLQGEKTLGADIEMIGELDSTDKKLLRVVQVLHIEPEPGADLALLRVDLNGASFPSIQLRDETGLVPNSEDIMAIGFPSLNEDAVPAEVAYKYFGADFGFKYVLFGHLQNPSDSGFNHTCITLGGSSGSPVISLKTGHAIGLHCGGNYAKTNWAVWAREIQRLLGKHGTK